MKINKDQLEQIYFQVKNLDDKLILSGLTILSKDLAEFFAANALNSKDVTLFQEVYLSALNKEREYWDKYGAQLFQKLSDSDLPNGFSNSVVMGDFDLSELTHDSIYHEWLHNPGVELFERFKEKFRETICGKDGPYEKFNNGLVGQENLPLTIASSILSVGLSAATFWYPLAVYIGLLIVKAGLKTYCEV